MKFRFLVAVLAFSTLIAAGCAHKKNILQPEQGGAAAGPAKAKGPAVAESTAPTLPGMSEGTLEEGNISETRPAEPTVREGDFVQAPEMKTIYFDYDKYELSDESRQILQNNAAFFRTQEDWELLVEGHCDERGTIEYNLALGQKRARIVREYYMSLGLPGEKISTLSYGKERPACAEKSEACWTKNRRAETKIRGKVSISTPQDQPGTP